MEKKERESRKRMEITEEKSLLGNTYEQDQTMNSHIVEEGFDAQIQEGRRVMHVKQENKSSRASSPNGKDLPIEREENHLKSAKAKVEEVRDENEKLKLLLAQMVKEYQSLQMHILDILQKEDAKKFNNTHEETDTEVAELVSLSLGRSFSEPKKDGNNSNLINGKQEKTLTQELDLGFKSTENEKKPRFEELVMNEEEATEKFAPSKMKTMRSGDEEDLQHPQLKKARVSVRARCDTPTMNDGCQWRKYGQKVAKGNPCPRAYYRCTVSPTCPVRKQVQRWVEDMSILITTYEGTHNHPLPISATAMASTTSAAASMLQCRSSTSLSTPNSTSYLSNLHGSNYSFSQNERPYQLYFPNSLFSAANSHPTVILDLTVPTTSSHFNILSSAPRFSSTSLNLSTPTSTNFLDSNHGTLSYNKNPIGSLNFGKQHISQSAYMNNLLTPPQQSLTETTKVITSNPNFQSALAAAITTYIGNGGSKTRQNQSAGDNSGLNLKWSESFPVTTANNGNGSVSTFPCPVLPFSTSKTVSGSPAHHTKDHFK